MANKNAGENGKSTRFDGNTAAKAGKKGAAVTNVVKKQYATFRESFKEQMTPERMARIFAALAEKAENGDVQAAAFLRDTMGEKPTEKVEQTLNEIVFRVEGCTPEEADELFG